jgi:hypothetical protein
MQPPLFGDNDPLPWLLERFVPWFVARTIVWIRFGRMFCAAHLFRFKPDEAMDSRVNKPTTIVRF